MAFKVNDEALDNDEGERTPETKCIDAGLNQARLVSYIELGWHPPIFQGKPKVYPKGHKKADLPKPAELMIHMIFEFPQAEHTSDYPQTIKTSIPYNGNEFLNSVSVSESLYSGNISRTYAEKANYMKYKKAMNDSLGTNYEGLADFVGEAFLITVTNRPGTKADADGNLPMYANMKADGINGTTFKNPATGKMDSVEVPEIKGEYCPVFSWDEPTPEAWKEVPKYLKECMKKAVDFPDSPLAAMLAGMPEEATQEGTAPADNKGKPAEATDDIPA